MDLRSGHPSATDQSKAVYMWIHKKTSVQQHGPRFGVWPERIEGWRAEALKGFRAVMRRGRGHNDPEAQLRPLLAHAQHRRPALHLHREEVRRTSDEGFGLRPNTKLIATREACSDHGR